LAKFQEICGRTCSGRLRQAEAAEILIIYVVMPRVTRLFKAWLYPAGVP
jgi:hypothetical protein